MITNNLDGTISIVFNPTTSESPAWRYLTNREILVQLMPRVHCANTSKINPQCFKQFLVIMHSKTKMVFKPPINPWICKVIYWYSIRFLTSKSGKNPLFGIFHSFIYLWFSYLLCDEKATRQRFTRQILPSSEILPRKLSSILP